MSTATDLGAPTFEQGAGLVNALAAVQGALSVNNAYANPIPAGSSLLYGPNANPQPGTWHFVLVQNYFSSGNQTSLPYSARIGFNTAEVSAPALPDQASVHLSASGAPVEIPIYVTNTGAITAAYFADARLATAAPTPLAASTQSAVAEGLAQCTSPAGTQYTTLPGACYQVNVPTETTEVQFFAQSPRALNMDVAYQAGNNLYGTDVGPVSRAGSVRAAAQCHDRRCVWIFAVGVSAAPVAEPGMSAARRDDNHRM